MRLQLSSADECSAGGRRASLESHRPSWPPWELPPTRSGRESSSPMRRRERGSNGPPPAAPLLQAEKKSLREKDGGRRTTTADSLRCTYTPRLQLLQRRHSRGERGDARQPEREAPKRRPAQPLPSLRPPPSVEKEATETQAVPNATAEVGSTRNRRSEGRARANWRTAKRQESALGEQRRRKPPSDGPSRGRSASKESPPRTAGRRQRSEDFNACPTGTDRKASTSRPSNRPSRRLETCFGR